jgi:alkanesulfonate monooxygenase SsuD/methylene tetrahydromethanopterin reductase-like flavin-dependent oxidoreductase (luciferase family)
VASGYLTQEFDALGIPFADRGPRTDEAIDAMREMWNSASPSFSGQFFSFSGIDAQPRPVRPTGVPIVIGGQSGPAYRRAISRGNGWYGFDVSVEAAGECLKGLEKARSRADRPSELGRLEISISPPFGTSSEDLRRYEDLGVDRLVPIGFIGDADAMIAGIEENVKILS